MIWAGTNIVGPTWSSRTRPGTGREALAARPAYFFSFLTNKKQFFYSEGVRSQIGISGHEKVCRPGRHPC